MRHGAGPVLAVALLLGACTPVESGSRSVEMGRDIAVVVEVAGPRDVPAEAVEAEVARLLGTSYGGAAPLTHEVALFLTGEVARIEGGPDGPDRLVANWRVERFGAGPVADFAVGVVEGTGDVSRGLAFHSAFEFLALPGVAALVTPRG